MTQPTPEQWDGTGEDPWMPQRLQQQAQVAVGERTIYDDYYARLAAWLAIAGRATLAGVIPNPDAVLNLAPRWVRSMTDFVHTTVAEMVGRTYLRVFGPGYVYDNRPFVVDYLARVRNRLVEVPEQTYALVTGQVAEGATAGESIARITDRIEQTFQIQGTPYWQNRPSVVARSETISALNAGRQGAFTEVSFDLGEPLEKGWLAATRGAAALRTRPSHLAADIGTPGTGQRVPLDQPFIVGGFPGMFPGAPELPAEESIQCLPGDTMVSFPGLRAATRRWYEGDLVKLSFASGDELSITPNHPVLRADGVWTPAGQINEGDHCVRAFDGGSFEAAPHEDGGPTEIGKVHQLAQIALLPDRVRISPPDFHGDGTDGHVDVVAVDRSLWQGRNVATDEEIEQFGLAVANFARLGGGRFDSASVPHLGSREGGDFRTSGLLPHAGSELVTPIGAQVSVALDHGLAPTPYRQVEFAQPPDDGRSADAKFDGDRLNALTALVATAQVVKIDRYSFSGHVYNLDTGEGWYTANSIICRNCRCTMLILRPGENVDLSNRQLSDF